MYRVLYSVQYKGRISLYTRLGVLEHLRVLCTAGSPRSTLYCWAQLQLPLVPVKILASTWAGIVQFCFSSGTCDSDPSERWFEPLN